MTTRSVWIDPPRTLKGSREGRKVQSYRVRWRVPGKLAPEGKTVRTRAEAEALRREIMAGQAPPEPRRASVTLYAYITETLDTASGLKPKSVQGYRSLANRWLGDPNAFTPPLPPLGARKLGEIRAADVRELVARVEREVSPSTAVALFRMLRRMLALAVQEGRVSSNVAARVYPSRSKRREVRPLEAGEVAALIAHMPDRYRALVTLLAYSGLRIGEALALRWGDVDLERGRVRVGRSFGEITGAGVLSGTTKAGNVRSVAIPSQVVEILRQHRDVFADDPSPFALVFTGERGGHQPTEASATTGALRYSNFRRVFLAAVVDAELYPPPRIHDLRHTAAAFAISAGYHPLALKEMLGHSSITVTLDIYGHLFESLQDASVDKLSAVIAAGLAGGRASSEVTVLSRARRPRALPKGTEGEPLR